MKRLFFTLLTAFAFFTGYSQIPNSDFESWVTINGMERPVGWGVVDSIVGTDTIMTCHHDTMAYSGHSDLLVRSIAGTGGIIIPGVAVSGGIDFASRSPKFGFPMTSRPTKFIGAYQYMFFGSDKGYFYAMLSKWDTVNAKRDTVAIAQAALPDMVMSWLRFSLPFTYKSAYSPDSAIIVVSSSGFLAAAGSYINLDSLGFATTTGIEVINKNSNTQISIIPNPAKDFITIQSGEMTDDEVTISLMSIDGQVIKSQQSVLFNKQLDNQISISELPAGLYLVRITGSSGSYTGKVIKQ